MSDIDRVFARLGRKQPAGTDNPRRELRHIPRKGAVGGGSGGRVVEVVRLPEEDQGLSPDEWAARFGPGGIRHTARLANPPGAD